MVVDVEGEDVEPGVVAPEKPQFVTNDKIFDASWLLNDWTQLAQDSRPLVPIGCRCGQMQSNVVQDEL